MASEEEEIAYISDYVVAILRSPTWVSPISNFVDDNCAIFENIEENKLEYTIVHNAFKQLVENLLVAHLCEMNLSTEQFTRFCERGLSGNNELHRSLVEQLISVDDFLVFKAMMVKRNCEINREVLGAPLTNAALPSSAEPLADYTDAFGNSEEAERYARAEEAERLEAERRCVEAELQLAEALSMQLEKRLQLMEALDEVLELVSKIYKLRADALEQQVAEEKQREADFLQQQVAIEEAALAPPQAPGLYQVPLVRQALAPVQHSANLAPVISSTISVRPLSDAPPLPPIPPGAGMEAIELKKGEAALQKERAERASAAKRQEMTATGVPYDAQYAAQYGMQQPGGPAAQLQPTDDEKLARAEHLKRQRAALIEKRNRERESQLTNFQMQHGATNASNVAQLAIQQSQPTLQQPDAGKRLAEELSGLATQPTAQLPDPGTAAMEMRRMLTRQLKNSFQ